MKRDASIQDFGINQQVRLFLCDGIDIDESPRTPHVVFPEGLVPQA
jgi:hypothetical protein